MVGSFANFVDGLFYYVRLVALAWFNRKACHSKPGFTGCDRLWDKKYPQTFGCGLRGLFCWGYLIGLLMT